MRQALRRIVLAVLIALPAAPAAAHPVLTAAQLADLHFRQHPGAPLPLETRFTDEGGNTVRLGQFFRGKPVVLVLEYLHCTTLCGVVLGNLAQALDHVPLDAGRDFQVVAVSIDPHETPADARAAKAQHLARYHHPDAAAGWHFLTGSATAIAKLADAVGFPYRYDEEDDQFAHPAGVTLAAPDGTIARYILGIDYVPLDLRLGLTEAAKGTISSPVTHLLLLCYGYDPSKGRYTLTVVNAMRVAGLVTVLGLAMMIVGLSRRSRRG